MDNKKLADYLHELVRFRNNEQVQKEEFNGFTEAEASYYQDRTDEIYKLACEYEQKHDEQCRVHPMTLDEAIVHANDVASKETCGWCAAEHKQLADWLSELKDIKNRYAYLAADFDNYKKRVAKNEQYVNDKVYENIALSFLKSYDDMERLYNALDLNEEIEESVSKLDAAFVMIFENFEKTLSSLGFEKIDCHKGDVFDVNVMEAISTRFTKPDEYLKPDEVADIYQTGWKYKDKVIRPVKVVVAK